MSVRGSRGRRSSPFEIDLGELQSLGAALGATANQMRLAYSRALNRTVQTLTKASVKLMRQEAGILDAKTIKRRVLSFEHQRESARELGGMKLWYGLNQIRLSELRGLIEGSASWQDEHHKLRDPKTGRYVSDRETSTVRFRPRGAALKDTDFMDAYVGENRKGKKTIFVRGEQNRRREAEMDIYAPMLDKIEDDIFQRIPEIFLHHYEVDLKGRVKAGIHTSLRGKRSGG
ncbi:hypothetical protein D8682_05000 [Buttiauxella sp. 3AFRM03]|uniref:hypothetical protein n=1 Tax=Buttiauxella sp. 3AFRM03 TaxID=2479367 RepID=UPI000EF815C0|nr:hypothetical protein [Buttiauxella sp. 3AFRM03]AYN26412.1 hypothetical protein D8682_05000 [Buttiauxella sp. 3AFRM03]